MILVMIASRSPLAVAPDEQALLSLLPARRRMANVAVTVTWLMAALFLMLGLEARSQELRTARATVSSARTTGGATSSDHARR